MPKAGWDLMGSSCSSKLLAGLVTCREPMLEQQDAPLGRDPNRSTCSLWEGLLLETFKEDCLLWEGTQAGAGKYEESAPW